MPHRKPIKKDLSPSPSAPALTLRESLTAFISASFERRLWFTTSLVASLTLLVKLLALGKEMMVAHRFGVGAELDAFNVAILLPSAFVNIIATSVQSAFIPVFVQLREQQGLTSAARLLSNGLALMLSIGVVCLVFLLLVGATLLPGLATGFSEQKLQLTLGLLFLVAPMLILTGTTTLLGAVLNAQNRFALVTLVPALTSVTTVICLFLPVAQGGRLLALAVLFGALLELCVLSISLSRHGFSLLPAWELTPAVRTVIRHSGSLMLGNLFMAGIGIASVAIAARFNSGSVAALSYAQKIIALPAGLAATALGVTFIPHFAQLRANENWAQIRQTLRRSTQFTFAVGLPVTLALYIGADWLVRMLFERGAFAMEAVQTVTALLRYFVWQLPFYIAGVLAARVLLALQQHMTVLVISGVTLCASLIFHFWLSRRMGLAGIALATSTTYFLSFLLLSWRARKHLAQ